MREFSQLLFNLQSPFRTLLVGLLVGYGLGLKAHPEILSAISLRTGAMTTSLLTLPAVSFRGKAEAGRGGAKFVHHSAVRLIASSIQSTDKGIHATETGSTSGSLATVNPTLYLRVSSQPLKSTAVKPNYRNSTLFCFKESSDTQHVKLSTLDSNTLSTECQLYDNSALQVYQEISSRHSSHSEIVIVASVNAFCLTASLLGYVFGISFLSRLSTTISLSFFGMISFGKFAFSFASDPLFFVILGVLRVIEGYKSLLHGDSDLTGPFYGGSVYTQSAVILYIRWVLVSLVLGARWYRDIFMIAIYGAVNILSAVGRPLFEHLGIKFSISGYSIDDFLEYMTNLIGLTVWLAFVESRFIRSLERLVGITCTISDHIQAAFYLSAQFILSSFLFCVDVIFYNCLLLVEASTRPLYGSDGLLHSGIKAVRLRISDVAFELEYVFPLLFYTAVLPAYAQETAGRFLETIIHAAFSVLLNGLLNVIVHLFLFVDGIAHSYHFSGSSSVHWTCRDRRIIEWLRKKGVIFTGTTSIALRPSNPFSQKQYVGLRENEDELKNIRKYHDLDYKFVAKIKRMGVDSFIVQHKVTGKKLFLRTAALKSPDRQSLIAELCALVRVDGCNWFPVLMDGLMDGEEQLVLTSFYPRGNLLDYVHGLGGCLDARLAKFYLAEMLITIQAIHAFGIIHRSVSAENLLLDDTGHLVLSNLSHCKVFDHNVDDETLVHPRPEDPNSIEHAMNSGHIDYYRVALVYYQIVTGRYLSFTAPLVHGPIGPREDHMQMLTVEDVQFLSRILDHFPANSPFISEITDFSLVDDIDWEAMCHPAISVPLTHRVLRNRSSRSFVHFEKEEDKQAEQSRIKGDDVLSPSTTVVNEDAQAIRVALLSRRLQRCLD